MKLLLALGITASLIMAGPAAYASDPVVLTPDEVEAVKLKLIQAKPNVSTVTLAGFLFPGSAQAYMGHTDRAFTMWGAYLLVFGGAKSVWAETDLTGGFRTSDIVITAAFMGMATFSAIDAFLSASAERAEYDGLINRLSDKLMPEVKGVPSVPERRDNP